MNEKRGVEASISKSGASDGSGQFAKVFAALLAVGMIALTAYWLGEALKFMPLAWGGLIIAWLCGVASFICFLALAFDQPKGQIKNTDS